MKKSKQICTSNAQSSTSGKPPTPNPLTISRHWVLLFFHWIKLHHLFLVHCNRLCPLHQFFKKTCCCWKNKVHKWQLMGSLWLVQLSVVLKGFFYVKNRIVLINIIFSLIMSLHICFRLWKWKHIQTQLSKKQKQLQKQQLRQMSQYSYSLLPTCPWVYMKNMPLILYRYPCRFVIWLPTEVDRMSERWAQKAGKHSVGCVSAQYVLCRPDGICHLCFSVNDLSTVAGCVNVLSQHSPPSKTLLPRNKKNTEGFFPPLALKWT